jgi:tRNA (guanine-N7-)-methyltransferase
MPVRHEICMTLSRSIYADKLAEFGAFAFAGAACTHHRGTWSAFFRERIGEAFSGRIILEIGCYNADFLSNIAAAHPTTGFVGLDWKCKQLYDGARHTVDRSLPNVALLRGRAQDIASMFSPGELDEIWVFHPEPCAEPHELPNRLIAGPFLRDARRTLREGASVCLKTDHRGYYEWTLAGVGGVAFHSPDYWNDPAALARTRDRAFAGHVTAYEQRFLKKKQPIHYVEWSKR